MQIRNNNYWFSEKEIVGKFEISAPSLSILGSIKAWLNIWKHFPNYFLYNTSITISTLLETQLYKEINGKFKIGSIPYFKCDQVSHTEFNGKIECFLIMNVFQ